LSCAAADAFSTTANATYTNSESGTCLISGTIAPAVSSSYTSCAGGTITINYSATDACNNPLAAQHVITVTPPAAPTVSLPTGLPTTLSYSNATSFTSAANATFTNNESGGCLISGPIPAVISNNYSICNGGTITINYSGLDVCNNPVTAQHIITVTSTPINVSINSTLSTIDLNQSTQLTAVGTPSGGTYSWTPSASVTPSNGDVVTATPNVTTTYTVNYDLGSGCITSASTTITVNNITVSVNSTTICSGSPTTLTATPSITGGTYLWSPGGQTTQSITVSPTTNAIYSCVYTLNGISVTSNFGTVTVIPKPVISVNSPTICSSQSATLNVTATPTGGSYIWQPNGQTSSSINVTPVSSTSYTVVYTLNGCSDTAISNVTVNPTPTVNVNNQTICSGQSTTLTATQSVGAGTFIWSNNQTSGTITVSPTVTTTYNVLYTLNGCSATGSGLVTVNPIPTVSVSNATICNGESATLIATPSSGGGTYSWGNNPSTTNSITVSPATTTTYSLTYTLNGCTSAVSNGLVTVNAIPTVTVNNASICEGQSATLTATPSATGGTYDWTPNGQTTSSINVSPLTSSTYGVTYTLNGCVSSAAQSNVTVTPIPTVSFIADTLSGCSPLTVNFSNTSGSGSNCSWSVGNGQSLSGCNLSYTFIQGGCYDITLTTTENGCSNTMTLQDYICVENPPIASFTIYPNAFTQESQSISFNNTSTGAVSYSWDFGDGQESNSFSPDHLFTNTMQGYLVTLTASTPSGCSDETQVLISYNEGEIFYIPNTFTPDGDGFNQTFKPIFTTGFDPFNFEMLIYNRWGELIFETHDANRGWDGSYGMDGRDVQQGVYTYKIIYKNPKIDERKTIVGHITLIK
jgi:gliding motility-associated-like protein